MSSHLSRQDMKRDEVREWIVVAMDWIADHGKKILYGVAALVLAAIIASVVLFFLGRREDRAQAALADAVEIYAAPINAEGADPEADSPSFPDEAARRARAKELFETVRTEHGSTSAAKIASVYLGEIAAADGDYDTARSLWQAFLEKEQDNVLAATVRLNLISLDRDAGKDGEVASRLRSTVDSLTGGLPPDTALFELGLSLERDGAVDEARTTFQRLVDDYPTSPYVPEARERLG